MKFLIVVLSILVGLVASSSLRCKDKIDIEDNTAFGYLTKVGQPLAIKIREAELASNSTDGAIQQVRVLSATMPSLKIVEGRAARPGDVPYQVGILITLQMAKSVCGGSLLNAKRVLTAAHCWSDGQNQAVGFTIVLGSIKLYTGGIRLETSKVITHEQWDPIQCHNDIAMAYLPKPVEFSNTIKPIALPSGHELEDSFTGKTVIVSGFGRTGDSKDITPNQCLSYVQLQVISNAQCGRYFPNIWPSHICATGVNSKSPCGGDSGGPLTITINNKPVLIGVVSFGSFSCQLGRPSAFTRLTSYDKWLRAHL